MRSLKTQRGEDQPARLIGWSVAALIMVVGTVWLIRKLTANRPGDAGPEVGPGAWTKVAYGVQAGAVIIASSLVVGLVVGMVAMRRRRPGRS